MDACGVNGSQRGLCTGIQLRTSKDGHHLHYRLPMLLFNGRAHHDRNVSMQCQAAENVERLLQSDVRAGTNHLHVNLNVCICNSIPPHKSATSSPLSPIRQLVKTHLRYPAKVRPVQGSMHVEVKHCSYYECQVHSSHVLKCYLGCLSAVRCDAGRQSSPSPGAA